MSVLPASTEFESRSSMFRSLQKLKLAFARPPNVEDVESILHTSTAGVLVTCLNAFIFAIFERDDSNGAFLMVWLMLTVSMCAMIYSRSRKARGRKVTHVSPKAVKRLNVFAVILALPWATLAFAVIGLGLSDSALVVLLVCAGMSAGGTFMLHRALVATSLYYVAILGTVIISAVLSGHMDAVAISLYSAVYGIFLLYFSISAGDVARERDGSVAALKSVVSDLESSQEEIYQLANVDGVTGLANRKAFSDELENLSWRYKENGLHFSLLLIDLDHFKNVNDLFGHSVGDELLASVGERLRSIAGESVFVARIGGDEFVVLLKGLEHHGQTAKIANDLIEVLSEPESISGKQIYPGASIGIATCPEHGADVGELMRNADLALTQAKEAGRGHMSVFNDGLRNEVLKRDRLEQALRLALASDEIAVHYQPKVALRTGHVFGAEALVRWHHSEMGSISPDVFLPIAAECGMLPVLSRKIAEIVARDVCDWRAAGLEFGKIALNIHPLELKSPELLTENIELLERSGLSHSDITLEVTEGCVVGRGSDAAKFALDELAERGFEIALDDFGTGHASLSHLRTLPVAEIKIDKGFVFGVLESPQDQSIISATVELSRGMGLRIVAEGIESVAHLEYLAGQGVDLGQGYFWAAALSAADYAYFVSNHLTQIKPDDLKQHLSG
ncbi:MAG: EAL domain-containing protein [Pseudomonadota bacterium]